MKERTPFLSRPHWSTILLALLSILFVLVPAAHAATLSSGPYKTSLSGQMPSPGKSIQDPAWVAFKLAGKVHRSGPTSNVPCCASSAPAAFTLDTSVADKIIEPPAFGPNRSNAVDANGQPYTDGYLAFMCAPGSTTVSLDYWSNVNTRAVGGYNYSDPHLGSRTIFWNDTNERSYMMYIAQKVNPPSYSARGELPGELTYFSYPTAGTSNADLLDALNWEASNHNSATWANFFYTNIPAGLSLSVLQSDIVSDIWSSGVPPIAIVNDSDLPSWSTNPNARTVHAIAIVGYDNNAKTFTYVETCGHDSCNTVQSGVFIIGQQQLLTAINTASGGQGELIW